MEQLQVYIQRRLHPYPIRSAQASAQPSSRPPLPDVRISHQAEGPGQVVEILEAHRFQVQLSPAYLAAVSAWARRPREERQQTHASLAQARLFLYNLKRRWQTLAGLPSIWWSDRGPF